MRSAYEVASKAGLLCKPFIEGAYPKGCGSSCSCTPAIDAIATIQRDAIEAAAKVADEAMEARAKGNPFVEPGDAIRRALLPAPAREGETNA